MNKSMTCIIVDDEPPAIRILQKYTDQLPGLQCVGSTNSAIEALQLVEKHTPDFIFLDIQMPELTGIQLSMVLKDKVKIIFTTAYTQFAMESYDLNVVDYLLKPISFERFVRAVEKVKSLQKIQISEQAVSENKAYFFVKTDGKNKFMKIFIDDIGYLESVKNYVIIHQESSQIVTYNTLKYYEENLPQDQFIKTHKSFLVSIQKIEKTDTFSIWIFGKELPLGETYKSDFFTKINQRTL